MECYLACAAVVPVWMTESRGIICDLGDSKQNTPLSHGYHVHLRVHPLHMFVTAVIKIPEKKKGTGGRTGLFWLSLKAQSAEVETAWWESIVGEHEAPGHIAAAVRRRREMKSAASAQLGAQPMGCCRLRLEQTFLALKPI